MTTMKIRNKAFYCYHLAYSATDQESLQEEKSHV